MENDAKTCEKFGNMKVVDAIKLFQTHQKYFASSVLQKLKVVSEDKGKCVMELKVEEDHQNMFGSLHGGLTATLIDVVTSIALQTANPSNPGVSVDLNITYMTAAKVGSTILIDAQTLKQGSRIAFLSCDIRDKDTGKMIAQGRHTKFIG